MKVAILYQRLFDADGVKQQIGGVETYLVNLAAVCSARGWEPILLQSSRRAFEQHVGDFRVLGVPLDGRSRRRQRQGLYDEACRHVDPARDLIIFGADYMTVPGAGPRTVAIQHGVWWDMPAWCFAWGRLPARWTGPLRKALEGRRAARAFRACPNRVCVDYNFLNWYRTRVADRPAGRTWIIPNFVEPARADEIAGRPAPNDSVRVLFARRFTEYRGTRLMAEAASHLLAARSDVTFTFAGEGPDEAWLRRRFQDEPRVSFTRYLPAEAISVHLRHDVAVVPSLASEGTSLAVAEAMGAGCAVVATAVGGITNMILNDYNGLLVMPETSSLTAGLARVVAQADLRSRLGRKAYETAAAAFGLRRWQAAWLEVLEEVARG
jgi:glycosyltransferase involved in cell wall biosynthesis